MIDIRGILARWVHPTLLVVVILIISYGAIFLQTAVRGDGSWMRQMQGIALGLILMAVIWLFDYRKLQHWLMPLFALNIFLLISPRLPFIGQTVSGATRWVGIDGVLTVQPSEPAKIVTIILLAAIIARYGGRIDDWRDFAKVVGLSLIPFFAVMTQPDLGTGLVFLVVMVGMLFLGGAKLRYMAALIGGGIAVVALVFWVNSFTFSYDRGREGDFLLIRNYQLGRLTTFIDRNYDPQGAGYDLNQSMIAIGSGGVAGKGLGEGTQSQFNFISERATDYIFSVLGEETGFVGTVALIGLYMALLVTALSIGARSSDLFGTLICGGIVCMWAFQIMQNIGMTMGLMPITGIPLPFMSYGLSAIVTNIIACGVLFAVWSRRPYQTETRGGAHDIIV